MIPLRYREQLPPYWYDNEVAETHFESAGGEIDYQKDRGKDIFNQFLLPYATWGLDFWDWMYFGEKQIGTNEERRKQIRKKNLSKAKFTLQTLRSIGKEAGDLIHVDEDFQEQKILFRFNGIEHVNTRQLLEDFTDIRPVHVKGAVVSIEQTVTTPIFIGATTAIRRNITIMPAPIKVTVEPTVLHSGGAVYITRRRTIHAEV